MNTVCETEGPTYTYEGSGHLDRVDYVAIPINCVHAGNESEVIDCIDMH